MNIEEFIEFTNSEQYYQNAHLSCVHIQSEASNFQNIYFDLLVNLDSVIGEPTKETWRLSAIGCDFMYNMLGKFFMPYIQLKLHKDHPLVWHNNSKMVECKLVGFPENQNLFLGDVYYAYLKVSRNWIQASRDFFAIEYAFKKNGSMNLTIPMQLKTSVETICKNHQIEFVDVSLLESQSTSDKELQALIFTNDYISPDGFNIGQPHILAKQFELKRIK
ncbi:hypothetical protein [Aquimarina intermedia]|uniref:Uncharacterized protein n=1 Tax=Aquimarina intermedia TaxID=350814 RepID=A0A5S5C2D2_9FLAO|nr:hypothetical protein [Aquimarina intermedia]TYP73457.1 hypothetical protein BD809_10544 [Aquimarina intermedia]